MKPTSPIQVVVIEDDARYRESLEVLLSLRPEMRLVQAFGSGLAALDFVRAAAKPPAWNLVLMDLDLPGMNGIEVTRLLKPLVPDLLVVVLTVFEEPTRIVEAICAGADGYLLKRIPPQELLEQIRVVVDGGAPLTAGVARTLLNLVRDRAGSGDSHPFAGFHGGPALTPREREVLRGLVDGLAYKQVADQLDISIDTVRHHIRGLYGKLQVHSVAEAVGRALRQRLV